MKKFTFKKTPRTGRYGSFELKNTVIKLDKKEVGYITENHDGEYNIAFAVKKARTKENPAPFRWAFFKKSFSSEKDARQFVKDYNDKIQTRYDLYKFED